MLMLALGVGAGTHAHAAQSSDQQTCINEMNKRGSLVAKDQGKTDYSCVRDAGRGNVEDLGIPPQAQTAQACLTNDVRGRVAKRMGDLSERETERCLATPEQLPSIAYTSAFTVGNAAGAASRGVAADIFGADLDAAIVSEDTDGDGAKCQQEVLKRANGVLDTLWKEALGHKKDVLRGDERLTGTPGTLVGTDAELAAELIAYVLADPRGKIAKAATQLSDKATQRCAGATTPLAQLFPGVCAGATDVAALAICVAQRATGRFYASLAAFDGLAIDCDLLDDGLGNLSCESPALKAHVLNRLGYGGDAWARARIDALGVHDYIEEQLSPETIDDSTLDALLASKFPSLAMDFNTLRSTYPAGGSPGRATVLRELQGAAVLRAVASRRQLLQVLVQFWFNHLNVDSQSSGRTQWDISPYERIAIRPHVLGKFRDLLIADARSPAMGDYLDNRFNKVNAINENYGREVMELHTVSVNGGYTETDVVEVARSLTGWREDYTTADGFRFQASWHDQGTKTLFGGALQIPANGGEQDGITVLSYLAARPTTANFLCAKLITRFVSETPLPNLVSSCASTYLSTDGDLRATLEALLLSPEFLQHPEYRATKTKRPLHTMTSLARALGADPAAINTNEVRNNTAAMGESLFSAGPPTGYPDVSAFWTSPGTLVTRFNEIEQRARGLDGYHFTYPVAGGSSTAIVDALAASLFTGGIGNDTHDTAVAFLDTLAVADQQRVQQAAAFLLSSPEFLLH
jgi:hypothetical protein